MAKTPVANHPTIVKPGIVPPPPPSAAAPAPSGATPIATVAPQQGSRAPAPTRIAAGGVVPPPRAVGAPIPIDEGRAPQAERARTNKPTRPRTDRVGTRMAGAEALSEPGAEAPKLRLTAGKVVPGTRYRILRWLGEGGMGVVYEAEHVDIERRVALKILRFDLSQQPRMVQVFRDEARAASRLGSQYIVEIYDFGELPDGRLFFAMELLEGRDLVPTNDGETVEPGRLVALLRQVSKGLLVAHRAGVVHRDVKPENIITVVENGRTDAVKIVDFGISAMLAAGSALEGGIAGTPHYMSPEQILGQPFDGRLDIYALGCTAYELLVGHPPFDADNVEELLRKHVEGVPLPPALARPDLSIPTALERVVLRCLEKDPAARYRDMADFEAALCEAQIADKLHTAWDDLPIPELPDLERRERLLREMPSPIALAAPRKRRWLWPAIAGVSTFAAAGLGLFLAFGRAPTDAEKSAVDELVAQAKEAAARTHWVVPPAKEPDAATAFQRVLALEDVEGRGAALADERAETLRDEFAATLVANGDKMWDAGATPLARQSYLEALAFDPENHHAFDRSGMTKADVRDFIARAKKGELTAAEFLIARATAAQSTDDPTLKAAAIAEVEEGLAAGNLALNTAEQLEDVVEMSGTRVSPRKPEREQPAPVAAPPPDEPVLVADAAPPPPAVDPAAAAAAEAEAKAKKKKLSDPRDLFGKAERDPKKAKELAEQGKAALKAGRRSEAESLFNQAIAHDRTNVTALMGLSDIYFDTGANDKAVKYAERAVEASPQSQAARLTLGDAYYKVLRYKDALEQYEKAKSMGSSKADDRIAKVKAKVGG
jgi:serine/threonine protein kinase